MLVERPKLPQPADAFESDFQASLSLPSFPCISIALNETGVSSLWWIFLFGPRFSGLHAGCQAACHGRPCDAAVRRRTNREGQANPEGGTGRAAATSIGTHPGLPCETRSVLRRVTSFRRAAPAADRVPLQQLARSRALLHSGPSPDPGVHGGGRGHPPQRLSNREFSRARPRHTIRSRRPRGTLLG